MELSIEQLADLKIAIKGESKKYDELKQTNEGLVVVNSNLTSNNKRLEKEIDEQVRIKEATIEENNKLRAEKEGINSEFEIKSNKQYEELRIKEQEIGDKLALIEARSKELEDRELKLFEKNEEIDRKISDLQQTKKEVKEDMIKSEKRLIEAREKETDIIKRETYLDKKDNDVRELLEVNEQEQEKIKKERKEILEISKKNQNALIETQAIEERMKADISRNEKLVVLLDETKNYLIGLEVVTKEELLGFIDKKFNGEEVVADIITEPEVEKQPETETVDSEPKNKDSINETEPTEELNTETIKDPDPLIAKTEPETETVTTEVTTEPETEPATDIDVATKEDKTKSKK